MHGRRAVWSVPLAFALLVGSLTSAAVVPSAYAEGTTAAFWGYVIPGAGRPMPTRVRAVSPSGVVCGSSDVATTTTGIGLYAMVVVSGDVKDGCPAVGDLVGFSLLYGAIDEDISGLSSAPFRPGQATSLHLTRPLSGD